jgi:hypothetical protein
MLIRYSALASGVIFILAAVGGFVPMVTPPAGASAEHLVVHANYGYLIGLFPVNVVHNLVHLSFGVGGLIAWRAEGSARWYARIMAMALGVLTVLGLIPATHTVGGVLPLYGHAIWLHGVEAIYAGYVGYLHPLRKGIAGVQGEAAR